MKTKILQTIIIALTIVISNPIRAQIKGSGDITRRTTQLGDFNAVEAGGAQEVVLINGDVYSVVTETNENLQDLISYQIK